MSKKTIIFLFFSLLVALSNTITVLSSCGDRRCYHRPIRGWRFTNRVRPFIGFSYTPRYYDYPYYRTYPYYSFGFGIGMPPIGYPVGFW